MKVISVDGRILLVRMKNTLGFISPVAVYAPTARSGLEEKEMFYTKLDLTGVLVDFNAVTGTDREGYELRIGPYGSGTRNINSSYLLDFARSGRLRIEGSWYQRRDLHRWTWYSNTGVVAKEIDHIPVDTRWRILQNCRAFRSAEFFATDHRLVVQH
ncbi:uncharacterized protein LOC119573479 [Penaeus monodon]|uniref:uncharacterized protein LOC119573479 n=1 Tax=Penaeus monodon TaxID=6687 RepID=UPI0018A7BE5A|nr:uncharacterized protein LOC119573479 [Penaeus monodon]